MPGGQSGAEGGGSDLLATAPKVIAVLLGVIVRLLESDHNHARSVKCHCQAGTRLTV